MWLQHKADFINLTHFKCSSYSYSRFGVHCALLEWETCPVLLWRVDISACENEPMHWSDSAVTLRRSAKNNEKIKLCLPLNGRKPRRSDVYRNKTIDNFNLDGFIFQYAAAHLERGGGGEQCAAADRRAAASAVGGGWGWGGGGRGAITDNEPGLQT